MPHSPINPPSTPSADDLAGMAWYNSASEETRRFWHCIAGSPAPVDAWIAYRDTAGTVCPPPATETASACLPAPADAGQGVGFCVPPERDVLRWIWRTTSTRDRYARMECGLQ